MTSNATNHCRESCDTSALPLVIDLDECLVRTDLLLESYFATAQEGLSHHLNLLKALATSKASLKAFLAERSNICYELLPYNDAVLEMAGEARKEGRQVFLATASNRRHAEAIAAHLKLFDGVFASDDALNLKGEAKARVLVNTFGHKGFDYIGNSPADAPVWAVAGKAYYVGTDARLQNQMDATGIYLCQIDDRRAGWLVWLSALRVHQYAKNILVFVPLLTAHAFGLEQVAKGLLAFLSFSLCASAVYLLNDLIDLEADRAHPKKAMRPLASGALSIKHAAAAIPALTVAALSISALVSKQLAGVLVAYLALTTLYSVYLKRKLLLDVLSLAFLYTLRIIAGAVAISVSVSEWLLAFSMFTFLCLALVKRHVELAHYVDKDLPAPRNRDYLGSDLPVILGLAAASGFNAVTIFTLYISSPSTAALYSRPDILWAISPILLYWL